MAGEGFSLGTAYGMIEIDTSGVDRAMKSAQQSFSGGIQNIGSSISGLGASLSTVFTPISLALGKATSDTLDFNEAIVNIQAVTGASADETKRLSDELLLIGQNSRSGPQAVAEAFYDIAGGVVDASSRMAILNAAVTASEAGNADLGNTTSALISIMNGYGFSANEAGYASDVLTQTVGKGVGTMDEFASALPNVTGLANSAGISFTALGDMMAFLTTKGNSASEAGTQLSGMIVSLLRPSQSMSDALKKIGFESGTAAIKQLGLVGTFKALKDSGADIPEVTGRVEALRGTIALTGDDFETFSIGYQTGLDGITEKTQDIQNASPAAQMDLFNGTLSTLSITLGETLIPALNDMLQSIMPIIQSVIDWVRQNPELTGQILMIAGALGVIGPILIAVGAGISAIGAIAGSALIPIIAIVGGLYLAFKNNFLGIRDTVQPILDRISTAFTYLKDVIFGDVAGGLANFFVTFEDGSNAIGHLIEVLFAIDPAQAAAIGDQINTAFQNVVTFITGTVIPALTTLADWFLNTVLPAIVTFITGTVIPAISAFFTFLGNAWTVIGPALAALADWFITTALPAIVNFVTTVVIPGIQSLINTLIGIWTQIQPGLQALFDWFVTTALPAIVNFIQTVVIPGVQGFIDLLVNIWTTIQPGLQDLWDWFTVTALPAIISFIQTTVLPAVQDFIDLLVGIWTTIQPGLQSLWDWFTVTALPGVVNFIQNTVLPAVQDFIDLIQGIWVVIEPGLTKFFDWVTKTGLPAIQSALQWFNDNIVKPISDALGGLFSGISNIGSGISGAASGIGNSIAGPGTFLGGIGTSISQLVQIGQMTSGDSLSGYSQDTAYMVGIGAQPEAFIPSTGGGGTKIPNFDQFMQQLMGGGQSGPVFQEGSVRVYANSKAEGEQAAIGFEGKLQELLQARGN